MHTDEYEIALFREVDVCKGHIRKHQRLLEHMEARHRMTSAVFLERAHRNGFPAAPEFREWQESLDALTRWKEKQAEYERLLGIMKISGP